MKINFILGSALLLSQPLCAQNEEAKDTLTAQMMMQNLPEVFVKATRPIVKAERGQLVYNMPPVSYTHLPYSFQTVGIDSPDDLTKSKLGEYGEMQHGWTAEDAKGFIKVSSTPLRVYYGMHPNEER